MYKAKREAEYWLTIFDEIIQNAERKALRTIMNQQTNKQRQIKRITSYTTKTYREGHTNNRKSKEISSN